MRKSLWGRRNSKEKALRRRSDGRTQRKAGEKGVHRGAGGADQGEPGFVLG